MRKRRIAPFRIAQIVSTVLLNAYILAYLQNKILYQGFFKHIPEPVLNCYGGPLAVFACPLGSMQQMIGMKTVPWLVIGVFVVIGAFVGRAACAWMCPFGLWQDLLYKVKAGSRAGAKRWVAVGVIGGIGILGIALLVTFLHVVWWRPLVYGWVPFMALVLFVMLRGKLDIPQYLHVGGFVAGVGLGAFVWLKYGAGFGVVAGVAGMVAIGLLGRWYGAIVAALAGFLLARFGPDFAVGPLSGATLGIVLAAVSAGLVLVLDVFAGLRLPSTFLKYGFFVLVAGVASYLTVEPWFCKLCPQGTLGAGIPLVLWDPVNALRGLVGWLYWVKVGILLLVVAAAIAIKRPFCRLVCPIGAIYGVFNKVSLLRLRLESAKCTRCGLCRKVCPMNIEPLDEQNQLECIRCFECVWRCPKSGLRITV
ncbi:MAG: 4Fe-4S binding protein [candidate division WOR-3 bacterium]